MKHIALVTVMVLIGSIVFAQSSNRVVLVNVDEAQESIENLRILNGTMEADSAGKQLIRDELRSEIAA